MRLFFGALLSTGVLCAGTIFPPPAPLLPGQFGSYLTHGTADGVAYTAVWAPTSADQSVWAVSFSGLITSYSLTLTWPIVESGAAGYVSALSTITEQSNWLSPRDLQLSGTSNPETVMYVIIGGGVPGISFTDLVDPPAEAPEPNTALLLGAWAPVGLLWWRRYGTTTTCSGPV